MRIADPRWQAIDNLQAICERVIAMGLPDTSQVEIDILLTDNAELQALNAQWRGKDRPTDILSFPADAGEGGFMGDIAIAYETASKDAFAQGKTFSDHLSHLLIHGLLHLRGFDHETPEEAKIMEAAECAALLKLGICDPYT